MFESTEGVRLLFSKRLIITIHDADDFPDKNRKELIRLNWSVCKYYSSRHEESMLMREKSFDVEELSLSVWKATVMFLLTFLSSTGKTSNFHLSVLHNFNDSAREIKDVRDGDNEVRKRWVIDYSRSLS